MAKSKFEYVRKFETDDTCLPNCWIVVRVDGKCFHRFSDLHRFEKPNDSRALALMTRAARDVMNDLNDLVLAYGQSDEYSFVFRPETQVYQRRASKLMTNVVSLFSSSFVFHWPEYFSNDKLQYPPSFDSRCVLYPSNRNLRDYLSWRQADCHINNLHNTSFWKLVHSGVTPHDAQQRLKVMLAKDKNEMLFSEFQTNYNTLPELYRKGTTLVRQRCVSAKTENETTSLSPSIESNEHMGDNGDSVEPTSAEDEVCSNKKSRKESSKKSRKSSSVATEVVALNVDIIGDVFWTERPYLLNDT